MTPQSPSKYAHLGTSHSFPSISSTVQNSLAKSFVEIAISCPILFSWMPSTVWNLFPFKGDFRFGKSQKPLLIAASTCSTFSGVLLVADLPERGSLSTNSQPSLKHLCHTFICAALITLYPKAFWIIWIVSTEECSSLTQNLMQIHCYTRSFWMQGRHSPYAQSMESMPFTD